MDLALPARFRQPLSSTPAIIRTMTDSTAPRDALPPDQPFPTRAYPIEEMEEKEICQPKLPIDISSKTTFVIKPARNRRDDVALSSKCSTN